MLNVDGWVSECTGDNLFIVKDGKVSTPSEDAGFLHGITRRFVIDEIGPACGAPVQERMMRIDEVLDADEVFLTGTAAELIAVNKVRRLWTSEAAAATARTAVALGAAILGAWAIPMGFLAAGLTRWLGFSKSLAVVYMARSER